MARRHKTGGLAPAMVLLLALAAPMAGRAQGYPLAQLACRSVVNGVVAQGQVQLSLFTTGAGALNGNAMDRQGLLNLLRKGRAAEIPGTVNVLGTFDYAGARLDLDVMLTRGNAGTGQYWFNVHSHRATIVELQWMGGGFATRDEYGATTQFACQ